MRWERCSTRASLRASNQSGGIAALPGGDLSGNQPLSRSLRARHLTMISIGGIIGAGVFVGSSAAIAAIGPAVVLSYLFAGVIVFAVVKILSGMALTAPGLGSFTEYIRVALGDAAGFVTGWLYWYFWVVVVAIEAIAGAALLQLWFPFEVWQIGLVLMIVLTGVNLASARSYGEFEFWFASLKVAAIVVFILIAGGYLLGFGPREVPVFTNLTAHGGFAPAGWGAIFAGMTTVIFSMCGAEITTIAAAESNESGKTLARLTNNVILRILLFYVLAIFLIVCIVPWTQIRPGDSPFALALGRMGIPAAATIMNVIVLTAVLSCLNSGVYVTARVLFRLADRGDAPKALATVNARQVPARAILLGSAFGYVAVLISVASPQKLFSFLVNASGGLMLIIYFYVCVAHFKFPYGGGKVVPRAVAAGAALAIAVVLASMAFIEGLESQLYTSLACLAVVIVAQQVTARVRSR
jgi:GABA permease